MLEAAGRMRAAYITELGPADAIRVGELPVPAIGPTDVLIRVEVVAVDPVDTMVRSGAYPTPTPFPFVVVVGRADTGELAEAAAVLNRRLAAEELPVRVHDIWPLDRAAEAHQAVERGLRGRAAGSAGTSRRAGFRGCRRSRPPWSRPSRPSAPAPSGRSRTGWCAR
jgi:hypothetical protein